MANRLTPAVRRHRPAGSRAAAALLLAAGLVTAAGAAAEPLVDEIRIRIERSYQAGDLANIEGARRELLQLATAPDSPDPASLAYFAAYGRFRQAMASAGEPATARRFLEDCITELTAVVRRAPGHAEARALLGSCHGMSTVYSPLATMTRGPEARRQLNEARRLAPDNPWVVMQDGLADWATPRLFGGNREVAVEKLERAARLFASAVDAGSRLAAWGAAETWRQLAPRYRELGRETEARLALDRANGDMPHFAAPRQVALQN